MLDHVKQKLGKLRPVTSG